MFDKTVNEIHNEMLQKIDKSYQKSVGFPTFDITRAFAIALQPVYSLIEAVAKKLNVRNLTGEELTEYVRQRKNIIRKEATKAKGVLTVYGNGTVNKGDLFETEFGTQFIAVETVVIATSGNVAIEAVVAGKSGNVGAGSIVGIPKTLQGINSCSNENETVDGYEEEADDALLERYLEAVRKPPTSGNKYHYEQWAKEVNGVGDAKVFPLWNGDNTVKIVIINDDKQPANDALIAKVQEHIDPNQAGKGEGEAPIGAYCAVVSATSKTIAISVKIKLLPGYGLDNAKININAAITDYFKEIAFKQNYVSYGKIANAINDSEGVEDYSDLKVNNGTANIPVEDTEVAISGVITIELQS